MLLCRSWVNSVSTVSDYRLDDRGSIPTEETDFSSSLCVQTSSDCEAHLASYPIGTGGLFTEEKARPRNDVDHPPHIVPRS
jgi:hypothetical protein